MKSRFSKFLLIFIPIVTALIITASLFCYKKAALWLYAQNPLPDKIEYLCSFAGNHTREKYALQLYRRYTPVWIASTPSRKSFLKWAYQNGVDTNKIIVTSKCKSTLDEIRFFKSQIGNIQPSRISSLAFVSSPLHMRRILVYNLLVNNNHRIHVYSLPVPLEQDGLSQKLLDNWQTKKPVRDMVYLEFLKMTGGVISTTPFLGPWFNKNIELKAKRQILQE